ncbi:MAG: pyruvate dehydrogenase, partial [Rhodothermales bacterium]|nr:pyruvate dehydrogenase [Rhodothermales bacterium]
PTVFFEHRALLDAASARSPYPGDDYVLPFGIARTICEGTDITIITWGAMVERCLEATENVDYSVEVIDLRTIVPWDRETVMQSVVKTKRAIVVHEDAITAGFGSEVVAAIMEDCFFDLDAPVTRLAVPDIPIPHDVGLMSMTVPSVDAIAAKIVETVTL